MTAGGVPRPPVLLITDRHQARGPLEAVVAAALEAGCRWVLLREKDLDSGVRLALLRTLLELGRPWEARILLSADPVAARDAGAAGVHLPAGMDPAAARAILGPDRLIGASAHGLAEAQAAAGAGADYVTLSPIFESPSKPGYGPALGLAGLGAVAPRLSVPAIALGGLDANTVAPCLAAGAAGVALMGAVMRAADPGAILRNVISALALEGPACGGPESRPRLR